MSFADAPAVRKLPRVAAALVLLLAAYLQIVAVRDTRIDGPVRGDARDYIAYALNLGAYGVFSRQWPDGSATLPPPDALRSPGYPLFVAAFIGPTPAQLDLDPLLQAQAVLGVATVAVYLLLFRRLLAVPWALAAAGFTAISPHLVNLSVYPLSEGLFTFLLGLHLLVLDQALRRRSAAWPLAAGVLLAASLLVRPTTEFLILGYGLAWLAAADSVARPRLRWLVLLVLPVVVAVGAWSWRNQVETGRPSDPTLAANFIQHGSYINLMYGDRPETYGYPYRFDPRNEEIAGSLAKVTDALAQRFRHEPARYLSWYLVGKPLVYLSWDLTESVGDAFIFAPLASPYQDDGLFRLTHDLARSTHPVLMLLAVIGIAVGFLQSRALALLFALVLAYFLLLHMVGAPFPRYSVPVRPLCYGLAMLTLQQALARLRNRGVRR